MPGHRQGVRRAKPQPGRVEVEKSGPGGAVAWVEGSAVLPHGHYSLSFVVSQYMGERSSGQMT